MHGLPTLHRLNAEASAKHEATKARKIDGEDEETKRKRAIELAREQHQSDGECEIDDNAQTSGHEENDGTGCYVQAWVWVVYPEDE